MYFCAASVVEEGGCDSWAVAGCSVKGRTLTLSSWFDCCRLYCLRQRNRVVRTRSKAPIPVPAEIRAIFNVAARWLLSAPFLACPPVGDGDTSVEEEDIIVEEEGSGVVDNCEVFVVVETEWEVVDEPDPVFCTGMLHSDGKAVNGGPFVQDPPGGKGNPGNERRIMICALRVVVGVWVENVTIGIPCVGVVAIIVWGGEPIADVCRGDSVTPPIKKWVRRSRRHEIVHTAETVGYRKWVRWEVCRKKACQNGEYPSVEHSREYLRAGSPQYSQIDIIEKVNLVTEARVIYLHQSQTVDKKIEPQDDMLNLGLHLTKSKKRTLFSEIDKRICWEDFRLSGWFWTTEASYFCIMIVVTRSIYCCNRWRLMIDISERWSMPASRRQCCVLDNGSASVEMYIQILRMEWTWGLDRTIEWLTTEANKH